MLSTQEFEKLKKRLALKPLDISSGDLEKEPGYLERIGGQYIEAAEDIVDVTKSGALNLAKGITKAQQGDILGAVGDVTRGIAEPALRAAGDVAGATFAPITEALSPVIKPLVEQIVKIPGVSGGVENVAKWAE